MTIPTRWSELYEAALAEIRRESRSPPGSMYDRDDRESAMVIATLELGLEEREKELSAKRLRQAIELATQLAEEEALFKLAMKAKQVAQLDRGREKIVGLLKARAWDLAARRLQATHSHGPGPRPNVSFGVRLCTGGQWITWIVGSGNERMG